MGKLKNVCLIIVLLFLLEACYTPRYVYSPAATNVPVLEKKGDNKLAAYYSYSPFSSRPSRQYYNYGLDIQAVYAISGHWALLANESFRYEKNSGDFSFILSDSSVIRYRRNLIEIGGGYFTPLSKAGNIRFQCMGGLGLGKFTMDDNGRDNLNQYYSRFHETGITKLFIQPAIQLRYNRYFTTSFATRFTVLWYHDIKTNYTAEELQAFLLNELSTSPRTFLEPSVINLFSFKKWPAYRIELQFDFASLVSHRFLDYRSINISAGATVDFSKLKKQRRS